MFGFTAGYPDSFQSSIVPEDLAEKDVLSSFLAVSIRHCQAILPYHLFLPSESAFCVLTRGVLREHIFIVSKWFDIEDTLLGREADKGLKYTFCRCSYADVYSVSLFVKWESPFILPGDLGYL